MVLIAAQRIMASDRAGHVRSRLRLSDNPAVEVVVEAFAKAFHAAVNANAGGGSR
jgi:hypothetical protein